LIMIASKSKIVNQFALRIEAIV